jgi:hypothetical protein
MDSLQKSASHALDIKSGPLAIISQLEGRMHSKVSSTGDSSVAQPDIAQLSRLAGEIAKSVMENSPFQALSDFRSIAQTIDAQDQQLYTNLLGTPEAITISKKPDTKD